MTACCDFLEYAQKDAEEIARYEQSNADEKNENTESDKKVLKQRKFQTNLK